MRQGREGFTLVELIVVVLIIGVLAAFAVPQYLKSVETSKADDAQAILQMVGTTNRMFSLDHGGSFVANTKLTASCNSGSCGTSGFTACDLVRCKYLAAQEWDSKPYEVYAAPSAGSCGGGSWTCSGTNIVACVHRRAGSSPGTNTTPYTNWGYAIAADGTIGNCTSGGGFGGTNPPPPSL